MSALDILANELADKVIARLFENGGSDKIVDLITKQISDKIATRSLSLESQLFIDAVKTIIKNNPELIVGIVDNDISNEGTLCDSVKSVIEENDSEFTTSFEVERIIEEKFEDCSFIEEDVVNIVNNRFDFTEVIENILPDAVSEFFNNNNFEIKVR